MTKVKPSATASPQYISFSVDSITPATIVTLSPKLFSGEPNKIIRVYHTATSNSKKKGR